MLKSDLVREKAVQAGADKEDVMKRLKTYEHTIYASYIGYITQAIVNNFASLLFFTFCHRI